MTSQNKNNKKHNKIHELCGSNTVHKRFIAASGLSPPATLSSSTPITPLSLSRPFRLSLPSSLSIYVRAGFLNVSLL